MGYTNHFPIGIIILEFHNKQHFNLKSEFNTKVTWFGTYHYNHDYEKP